MTADWTGTVPAFAAGSKLRGVNLQTMADIASAVTGTWSSWSPTYANLTIGSGIVTAVYRRTGKTVDFRWRFTLGAGSAVGTTPTFTLPATPDGSFYAADDIIGIVAMLDAGTALYSGVGRWTGSAISVRAINAAGTYGTAVDVTAAIPFAWGSGDIMGAQGTFFTA